MAKTKGFPILLILIVVAVLVGLNYGIFDFIITGSETMSRDFSSEVEAGSSVTITYSVTGASGKWAVSVIDNLGDCRDSNGNLITIDLSDPTGWKGTITKQFVLVSTEGTTITQIFAMPKQEGVTCTFFGNYQFGDKTIKNFPAQTIKTKIRCNTEADTNCDGKVDRAELGAYIQKWINNQVTRNKLGEVIMAWVSS